MAQISVIILDNKGLKNIYDIQGIPYGKSQLPDPGAYVVVHEDHPEIGKKLYRSENDVVELEEIQEALDNYRPTKTKRKTYKTKDTAAEE